MKRLHYDIEKKKSLNVIPKNYLVSIEFQNNEGYSNSITHYYHFLLAGLFPLIEYHLKNKSHVYRIVTDVGPMKRILCELSLNIVELLGPLSSIDNTSNLTTSSTSNNSISVKLPAYDSFGQVCYTDPITNKITKSTLISIVKYFSSTIPRYISEIPTFKIVLIERTIEPYFKEADVSKLPEHWTSGSQRRSINNHIELSSTLSKLYNNSFLNISLERTSIYYQYHVFNSADIIIGQHGAALTNIVFMKQSSHVIEISPPWSRELNHFLNISKFMNIGYTRIIQSGDHSDININEVVEKIEILNNKI
jgi:hypothetical protein